MNDEPLKSTADIMAVCSASVDEIMERKKLMAKCQADAIEQGKAKPKPRKPRKVKS